MTGPTPDGAVLDGLPGAVDIASALPPDPTVAQPEVDAAAAQAALERAARVAAEAQGAYDELAAAREQLKEALEEAGYAGAARFEIDERGLVVHIVADAVLFDAEEAELRPEGAALLSAVAPTLVGLPNVLRVEGHANHLPVTAGGRWPSNWELSAGAPARCCATSPARACPRPDVRGRLRRPPSRWSPSPTRPRSTSTAASTSSSSPPPRPRPTHCCRASTPHPRRPTA